MMFRFNHLLALATGAAACSYVRVTGSDGTTVSARTQELTGYSSGANMEWQLVKVPIGTEFRYDRFPDPATLPPVQQLQFGFWFAGCSATDFAKFTPFTADYGFMGIPVTGTQLRMTDAVNEKGLAVGLHVLRKSVYQEHRRPLLGHRTTVVCAADLLTFLVAKYATVAEVKEALTSPRMRVVKCANGPEYMNFHWTVDDAAGESVVLEYIDGNVVFYNNGVGVMTNDPPFPWHLANLNNYVHMSTAYPDPSGIEVDSLVDGIGAVPQQLSYGTNLLGLPSDGMPPSRFVKLFYLKQFAVTNYPPADANSTFELASTLLDTVKLVKGSIAEDPSLQPLGIGPEFTQWTTLRIVSRNGTAVCPEYYVKTSRKTTYQMIRLCDLDFTTAVVALPLDYGSLGVQDATADFQ